jgi:hypothetical protein
MGLLDAAIREHLDLKRRRGADPAEVERAEREALGPVRRGPEESEEPVQAGADDALVADEALAYDQEDEQDWDGSLDEEPAEYPATEARAPEPISRERPSSAEEPDTGRGLFGDDEAADPDDPFASDEPFADTPSAPTPAPHPAHGSPTGQPSEQTGGETVEYEVEAALEQEGKVRGADDPLEETPEFLQDTPDHDRLWFEQRPPRDFDFDD